MGLNLSGWTLWELVINAIEIIFVYNFLSHCLQKKRIFPAIGAICLFIYISCINLAGFADGKMTTILSFCGFLSYSLIAYHNSLAKRLLFGIIPTMVTMLSDFLTFSFATVINIFNPDSAWSPGILRFYMTLIYIIIAGGIYIILYYIINKGLKFMEFPVSMVIYLIIVLLLGILALNFLMDIAVNLNVDESSTHIKYYIIYIGIVYSLIFSSIIIFLYKWAFLIRKNHEFEMQTYRRRMESDYYKNILKSVQNLKYLQHDIVNHMQIVKLLLDSNKINKATQYISELYGSYQKEVYIADYTNDTLVNAMLSQKRGQATENNIDFRISVQKLDNLILSPQDLCSLLGNLLDNAIEACLKEDDERFIDLFIYLKENRLHIIIKNKYSGVLLVKNRRLNTSKLYPGHGIGLKIVRNIIKHNMGDLEQHYNMNEKIFTTLVTIPIMS